jgi:hypothetical protein
MSDQPGHEGVPWEAARVYRKNKANEAIDVYDSRIILFSTISSDVARTPAAYKAEMQRQRTRAIAAGIQNFEVHCTIDNEADREWTTTTDINNYKALWKDIAPAVREVPGCSMWMNLTRYGITQDRCDVFVTSDMIPFIDGFAINCYDIGMEETPIQYSTNFASWMDPMFNWVASKGGTQVSGWETGTRNDSRNLRPAHSAALARGYRDRAVACGLTPRVLAWWDNVTTTTRDCRLALDGTATRDAWRNAFN